MGNLKIGDVSGEGYIKFGELPVLGRFIRGFDIAVGDKGLQLAMMGLIESTGSRLEICGRKGEVKRILSNESVLVVANHPYDAEVIPLLAALPLRKDVYVVGTSDFVGMGSNVSNHLIPVYINRHVESENQRLSVRLGRRFKFGPRPVSEEAQRMNKQAIKDAGQRIREGGMVVLFPEGLRGKGGKWFPGIGWLLNEVRGENEAYFVRVFVQGTSNLDPLRLIPGFGKLFPVLRVTFSKPQRIVSILDEEMDPKRFTKKLQGDYQRWSKSLG